MGRNIVLLSDGTGNSSGKVWRTNVWRVFEALDLSGSNQVAFYDDGVGTSSFRPLAMLGGAFGFGLRRNVIDIYKFACRNYRDPSDKFFGFGFSRGAFTIRIVMGLIASQGIIKADSEAELHSLASAAYRAYRKARYKKLRLERPYQFIRNMFGPVYPALTPAAPALPAARPLRIEVETIHFIGVWDTVSAYGFPIKEMNDGVHKYLWPIELPDGILNKKVEHAFQALALDEERTTFHPQLWSEDGENVATHDITAERTIADERITQAWFPGVHSNVGGGYPDDSLAYIPLVWMISQAMTHGLTFKSDYVGVPGGPPTGALIADPDTMKNALSKRDKDGRLYDPRSGLGGYYRYGPRKLVPDFYPDLAKGEGDEVVVKRAKIHESVFKRIANHAHAYAPVGLPPLYDVLLDDGRIIPPDQFVIPPYTRAFESNAAAADRAQAQEHVWNEIWKRRANYFLTLAATLWLLIFPLVRDAKPVDELTSRFRWVSDILRVIQGFLPSHARFWIDGYAREPGLFLASVIIVFALLTIGSSIAAKTSGKMTPIWLKRPGAPQGLPDNTLYRLRSSRLYAATLRMLKEGIAPIVFAIMFVYLGLAVVSHLAFNIQDVWGVTCQETPAEKVIYPPLDKTVSLPGGELFRTKEFCQATGLRVVAGEKYKILMTRVEDWSDGGIAIKPGASPLPKANWFQTILFYIAVPLRRELFEDWLEVVFRYGRTGGEEVFYVYDPTDPNISFIMTPTRDGELFIFVNDAVIGIPRLYDTFYRNNHGTAQVTVTRIK